MRAIVNMRITFNEPKTSYFRHLGDTTIAQYLYPNRLSGTSIYWPWIYTYNISHLHRIQNWNIGFVSYYYYMISAYFVNLQFECSYKFKNREIQSVKYVNLIFSDSYLNPENSESSFASGTVTNHLRRCMGSELQFQGANQRGSLQ